MNQEKIASDPQPANASPITERESTVVQGETTNFAAVKKSKKSYVSTERILGVLYVIFFIGLLWVGIFQLDKFPKLAFAFFGAAVVLSQIVIDLGTFTSPKSKAWFSVSFRVLAAAFAFLAVLYL